MTTENITTAPRPVRVERTGRELLSRLGMGHFNITMTIPYLWIAPAATDPKAAQIILIVEKVQRVLNQMGAGIIDTGYLDLGTAKALVTVVGERWMSIPWAQVISAVLNAREAGLWISDTDTGTDAELVFPTQGVSGFIPGLPDVPGGLLTYGIVGYLLYRHFSKKR